MLTGDISEFAAFYTHVEQLLDDAVAEFVVKRLSKYIEF